MSSVTNKLIAKHTASTNKIATLFIQKYFEVKSVNIEFDWVCGKAGTVLYFADYWMDFQDMIFCLEKEVSNDKYFEWYDWNISNHPTEISLEDFCLGAEKVKQKKKEQLKVLKERIEFARKELEKATDEFKDWDITLMDGIDEED